MPDRAPDPCPNDADLAGFLNDLLTGERLARVSGHVDACPDCQARLDRLIGHSESAAARLKQLSSAVVPPAARTGRAAGGGGAPDTQVLGAKPPPVVPPGLPRVRGFEVLAEIGRGGMGVVYKARHLRMNRLVALKMILAGAAADARVVQRFLFEAEFLAKIQHPQVVQVYEIDMFQGPTGVPVPYLAMELLEGGSLHRRLKESSAAETDGGTRWPTPRAAAELVEGIARAVHAAHLQGVIHRDLKPGNILFPKDEGGRMKDEKKPGASGSGSSFILPPSSLPKVMDFGLAKFTQDAGADLTQSGQIVGTPHYMAPEQAAGGRQANPAIDVYSLGAILYECLAGRPPFVGAEPLSVLMQVVNDPPPDVRTLRPDLHRDLAAVTMKCLEKDPARRYPTAEALAKDLRRFLDDHPTRARPVRATGRAWLWAKRNPTVAGLCAALVAVLIGAFVTVGALWLRAEDRAKAEQSARADAEREKKGAEAARDDARRQEAVLEFRRGMTACEEARMEEGLTALLRAVQLAEQTGDTELARVARINLAVWPRDLAPPPRPFAHRAQPRLAAFHPDGKHLATAGRGGELYLWDIDRGARVKTFKPPLRLFAGTFDAPTYWTVAVSPDGRALAAGSSDKTVTLWKLDPSDARAVIPHAGLIDLGAEVFSVGFAPDGALWCSDPKGLAKLDIADPERPRVLLRARPKTEREGEKPVQILTVGPGGKRIYTGDRAGRVREWDAGTATELNTWQFRDTIADVAVSPDGARLAATGPEGAVWTVNLTTGAKDYTLRLFGAPGHGVAFTGTSGLLAVSDGDGNVRFWRADVGHPVGVPQRFRGEVTQLRVRPGTDELAVPAGDTVFLARALHPPGDLASPGHGLRVRGLDFAPDGRLAVADDDHIDLLSPLRPAPAVALPRGRKPLALRYDPDPARPFVYVGVRDGFERAAIDGKRKAEPVESSLRLGNVHALECLPGAGRLYARGDTVVARFDPVTLARLAEKRPVPDIPGGVELGAMAVRPDGGEVLVTVADRVVFLHGETLDFLREWPAADEILSARYTPDGSKVLLGRRDNAAELLDAATGKPTGARPMPHARAVTSVAVGRGGALLLTGSRDMTARFWDAPTGLPLGGPLRHAVAVTQVALSPDGEHAATAIGTGHVSVWDAPPPPLTGTIDELRAKLGLR